MIHDFYAFDTVKITVATTRLSRDQDKTMYVILCDVMTKEETNNSGFSFCYTDVRLSVLVLFLCWFCLKYKYGVFCGDWVQVLFHDVYVLIRFNSIEKSIQSINVRFLKFV